MENVRTFRRFGARVQVEKWNGSFSKISKDWCLFTEIWEKTWWFRTHNRKSFSKWLFQLKIAKNRGILYSFSGFSHGVSHFFDRVRTFFACARFPSSWVPTSQIPGVGPKFSHPLQRHLWEGVGGGQMRDPKQFPDPIGVVNSALAMAVVVALWVFFLLLSTGPPRQIEFLCRADIPLFFFSGPSGRYSFVFFLFSGGRIRFIYS